MADDLDRTPTPPPSGDPQGLPPRPGPYVAIPGNMQFVKCQAVEGATEPIIALVYDSADIRSVSYWSESAFVQLGRNILKFAGEPSLTIADISDLRDLDKLKDVRPFEGPLR